MMFDVETGRSEMTSVEIMLPDSLFAALRKAPHEVPREMRIAASIHWYQQSVISMERAAEVAGMTRAEFLDELARRRVDVFVVDEEDLARELRSV
jgi:predicted HTH domain antitoxin